ncbi:tRNA(Met) cytidine acetyltransferase TmcA [Kushneria indalinina]|uniref:tRNA(Met) cytidine acetyltransferase TmcA n=1 Tax=Kushneria indalinina DSM 14324 TaxID=1122140 RepID=A0A3D9DVA6_9GAMM|nr:GNAT family N-acetyltransferase [Kushneria indalinina]REC94698.1 tRNA(Met)-cytidine N(4)-acetyltransferase [Kushneria indalinina DSM 14324]
MSDDDVIALHQWRQTLNSARHRGLVWLCGPAQAVRARAAAVLEALALTDVLWAGLPARDDVAPAVEPLAMNKARTRLGTEQGAVVFDAFNGFDPDAFGALAGTVRAGGLVILLTPDDWGQAPDGDYARLADHPFDGSQLSSRYLARLARLLKEDAQVARWIVGQRLILPTAEAPISTPSASVEDGDCLSPDQARAVAAITRLRRRRPLVLTADRGRGKSAALGIGAAQRLMQNDTRILITAPRFSSVAPVFERLAALLPDGVLQDQRFVWQGGEVCFVAPDRLVENLEHWGGDGSVLLIDEAAALPAALLHEALRHFPRVVFATTVHGYEGSGRGFALRFRARLDQHAPQWKALTLDTPVRWAAKDPLERSVTRLLALAAEPPSDDGTGDTAYHHRLDRDALALDEPRLEGLFALLVQAHYRTSPADLRTLLDGPGIGIETLESAPVAGEGRLLAVAVTVDEGGFDDHLAEQIARGERRPRGHLMAQSLALHGGVVEAATHRLRRIMRLAVLPGRQRQGLGRRLVAHIVEGARADDRALLGASLGAEPGLMAFWQRCGLSSVRLGLHPETSTGEHPVMMSRALNERGAALQRLLDGSMAAQLPGLLAFELSTLSPAVVAQTLRDQRVIAPASPVAARAQLDRLAFGQAPLVPSRQALVWCVHQALHDRGEAAISPELITLCGLLWQGHSLTWLARRENLTGSAQAMDWLRRQARLLLEEKTPS